MRRREAAGEDVRTSQLRDASVLAFLSLKPQYLPLYPQSFLAFREITVREGEDVHAQ